MFSNRVYSYNFLIFFYDKK
nr:cytochrome b6/f subunit L [Persicaria capitata]WEQ71608.1 cytochrome b6/f subunit L [Persicaria capitata]